MVNSAAQTQLEALHSQVRRCRKCAEAGYFVGGMPIFGGPITAQVVVVGQAPGRAFTPSLRGEPLA